MLRQQKKESEKEKKYRRKFFFLARGGLIDLGYSLRLSYDWISFLSAAQPTDQGEESVILLVVVVGDHFSFSHVQFFFGGVKKNVSKGV